MKETDLLATLNPEQRRAVTTIDRPVKIVAGAGTGKTRVITTKIAHLIKNHNFLPWQILAVTFTNKAAREMKERVAKLVPEVAGAPWILTFHALAVRILRTDFETINLAQNFNIIDAADQKTILRQIVKELLPDEPIIQTDLEKKSVIANPKLKKWFTFPRGSKAIKSKSLSWSIS